MGAVVKIPTTITSPLTAFVPFEGVDMSIAILGDWLKTPGIDPSVYASVSEVRDALRNLCEEADVIMLEDT